MSAASEWFAFLFTLIVVLKVLDEKSINWSKDGKERKNKVCLRSIKIIIGLN